MEAKRSEVEKMALNLLPAELRRQLLASMTEQLAAATDPLDIECLTIGIENLKKSFD